MTRLGGDLRLFMSSFMTSRDQCASQQVLSGNGSTAEDVFCGKFVWRLGEGRQIASSGLPMMCSEEYTITSFRRALDEMKHLLHFSHNQ